MLQEAKRSGLPTTRYAVGSLRRQIQKTFNNIKITILCGFVVEDIERILREICSKFEPYEVVAAQFSIAAVVNITTADNVTLAGADAAAYAAGKSYKLGPKVSDWDQQREQWPITNPGFPSRITGGNTNRDPPIMDLRNTPFTVQLGRGASIQLANATINTGNSGATIQFGELQFSLATASAAAVPVYGMDTKGPVGRPYTTDVAARHVHPPPRRPQPTQAITANEFSQRRVSVFKRLSNSETLATRRVMDGKQISVLPATTTTLPTGFSVPGRNDAEASSSGGRPSRRQRRRMNAELRAQQLLQVHPSTLSAQEPEASVPTQNKFTNLKWVKRNSSTGELKQSFWEQRPQAPVPQKKKEPETLSGRVHRVLKTVKERGLMKKKYQRPLVIEARRTPSRELPPLVTREKFKPNLQEAHRGVTLGPRVQESATERAQQKDKQVWRPRLHERKALGRQTNMGVTSGAASQRSGPTNKSHKEWVPKKVLFDNPLDGRHPGESSRESHHQPIASSQEEASFDRSPRIEEFFMRGDEPEIQWKRRSGINTREDGDEDDKGTMRVEVVYMVEHDDEPPPLRVYRRQHGAGSTAGRDEDSSENEEEEEFEENPLFTDTATLAEAQRQMHRQMKAKDKEIAHLNAKMTEMMTQMTMMMQMMQRNITANPIPVQQTNHQATSSGLANPPVHPVPQVSGVRESTRVVTSSSIPPTREERTEKKQTQGEQWKTAISKKTTKMLKQLEGVPGVKWKSPTEPVLDLKALPIAQTSTFKQRPNQAGSSKSGKEKPSKRKTKLKKFKEKRTATQRAIDCLDEYYQTVRRPIKLADFMSELKVAEAEEANEEPLPVETCRVISVTPVAPIKDKYVNELVVEICLATSSMDYSSEEDLYFPREVESEHDITSQMEHVQLEGDSELEGEKKQVWRKKATPTLPKTVVISKERKNVPHLGSDTEEDVTSTKSQKVCQSTAKKKKKVEYSDSDYDYESTYASTVQCVFSRRIGSLSISDSVFVVTRIPMQHFKEITPREDTVVRWSAAKGIGRITACLTSSLAEEVSSSILELFSPGEGDGSWHGGCLALAEFARRGLLLPASFPKVVPLIIKALHYDIRRGPHSIGSHVRDAAAYVCWAFGRAYNYSDMKGILEQLAPHLLTVACYDREVNCRRAASAAFQENIGRQGDFPHGIDIVSSADYFSLASRTNSYLNIAVSIAQYKEYLCPFVEELLSYKISHWDRSLRELAAQAISALAKYDPDYFAGPVLGRLIPLTLSVDLCTRHGATLAVGELVLALHECNFFFHMEKQQKLAGIVPAIEKARLYRGKGGEIMRSAVSRFIDCISRSAISLNDKTRKILLDTLTDNLKHPNAQIQCSAVDALRHFVQGYLVSFDEKVPNGIISKYLELLDDPNVAARRGAALGFGILPYEFLCTRWREILRKLCKSCLLQNKPDDPDAEARVNAVRGLVSVCETLTRGSTNRSSEENSIHSFIKNDVMRTLFDALDDYAIDNRGDVGSWVRDAAMDALERCTYILCKYDHLIASNQLCPLFDEKIATELIKGIAKQAVEKMDKIRGIAARILQRIIHYPQHFVPYIPHRETLEEVIPLDTDLKWEDPTVSYPRFVQLLQFSCYSRSVLSGYVISVGGLQEFLSKASKDSLLEFIEVSKGDSSQMTNNREFMLSTDLLWVLQNYQKCNRVIMPTMKLKIEQNLVHQRQRLHHLSKTTLKKNLMKRSNGILPLLRYNEEVGWHSMPVAEIVIEEVGVVMRFMAETIEILLSGKLFLNMEGHTLDFCRGLLDSLAVELKGTKDFTKLYTGISILGYVSSLMEPINCIALAQLLYFLGHRYPKIRKAAADQVYLVFLQNATILMAEDKVEKSLEILAETSWDGSLEDSKLSRLQLFELAGFEDSRITSSSAVMEEASKGRLQEKSGIDENMSYSSLVDFTGF
ncbi:hypothetical protein M5K25_017615 [Dendrobium thyrsiflorum]|uniref:Tubulin-specific chaperone D n=1 Tax=Dendrobium thyrsiflorum TaxID=117978 RepID=A0ABD0UV20_DENTH